MRLYIRPIHRFSSQFILHHCSNLIKITPEVIQPFVELGFALPGGLSFVIPAFTVTAGIAYGFALAGAVALPAIYAARKFAN
ncbi:hypothetical protein [Klebsiella pneumoniae]|uniref:hypothetical protein n=1 Tax=Klebsiella pneumoniae TaxID=573 RepID=UPI0021680904|nr:hypothetical protein [Klebsiella pneumoniae]